MAFDKGMSMTNPTGIRRTFDPQDVARQTDKHMHKLPCFWPPDWVSDERNYALVDDHGNVGLMDYYRPHIYETHIYFEDRGKEALRRLKAFIDWAFENTDVELLIGKTPVLEKGAWMLTRLAGMKKVGMIETTYCPMHMSAMSRAQWMENKRGRNDGR